MDKPPPSLAAINNHADFRSTVIRYVNKTLQTPPMWRDGAAWNDTNLGHANEEEYITETETPSSYMEKLVPPSKSKGVSRPHSLA